MSACSLLSTSANLSAISYQQSTAFNVPFPEAIVEWLSAKKRRGIR
jgi:hypothetical protein